MNESKKSDNRFWKKWEESGALGNTVPQYNKNPSEELSKIVDILDGDRKELFREEYLINDFEFGKNYLSTKPIFECPEEKIDTYLSLTKQVGEKI